MKAEHLEYPSGEMTMRGYLAYDETLSGQRPGVLVIHEAFGVGEHVMERTRMLAELGYVAFAADMFGGGRQIEDMQEALSTIGQLMADPPALRARALSGLAVLSALPQVNAQRLGAIGFCFGGSTVLELVRHGTELAAVVSFHGALQTALPAEPGGVKSSVLACVGADDPLIPQAQVDGFEVEMRHAGADWQLITYGGTGHSFTNIRADGSRHPAVRYNKLADQRSWHAMRGLFDEKFNAL